MEIKVIQPRFKFYDGRIKYLNILKYIVLSMLKKQNNNLDKLEQTLSKLMGDKKTIVTSQARLGIYLALKSAFPNGGEIIVSSYNIYDVINMIICAGCTPIFADIDQDTLNIDIDSIKEKINEKTKAVLVTHLHGINVDIGKLKKEISSEIKSPTVALNP